MTDWLESFLESKKLTLAPNAYRNNKVSYQHLCPLIEGETLEDLTLIRRNRLHDELKGRYGDRDVVKDLQFFDAGVVFPLLPYSLLVSPVLTAYGVAGFVCVQATGFAWILR